MTDAGGTDMYEMMILITALDNNSASDVLEDTEMCKDLIIRISKWIKPEELRYRLISKKLFWTSSEQGDLSYFMKWESTLAVEAENGEAAWRKMKNRGTTLRKRRPDKKNPGSRRAAAK